MKWNTLSSLIWPLCVFLKEFLFLISIYIYLLIYVFYLVKLLIS